MLIDMHTHTSVFSTDSNLLPHDALVKAAERGVDGVILTEHDVLWPADRVAHLSEQVGILVLAGVEVTTELGHVLVYGLTEAFPRVTDSKRLRDYCSERHALMFLAHPGPRPWDCGVPKAAMELFDGVEGTQRMRWPHCKIRALRPEVALDRCRRSAEATRMRSTRLAPPPQSSTRISSRSLT